MSLSGLTVVILGISFLSTVFLSPLIRKLALRAGFVDNSCSRKIHKIPTPRLGGIGIYFGIMTPLIIISIYFHNFPSIYGLLISATLLLIVGIIDDIYTLSPFIKLGIQIIVALITYTSGISIEFVSNINTGILELGWLSAPLTIVWIVALINVVNIIDGLDGLAAGITAITATVLAVVSFSNGLIAITLFSLAILGACLGFLKHNFFPAKIFMGDTGAMLLGYFLAITSILGVLKSTVLLSLSVPIIVLAIPILDVAYAIIRRMKNGKGIFKADNHHFHHKLLGFGLTQKQVVLFIYLMSILLGIFAILVSFSSGIQTWLILLCLTTLMIFVFFWLQRHPKAFLNVFHTLF